MSDQLLQAHRQWANRPADQRFLTLDDLQGAVDARRGISREATLPTAVLRVKPSDQGGIYLAGGEDNGNAGKALFTHHAFGQLAYRVGAPAHYLRTLPAPLAAINLRWGLEHGRDQDNEAKLLVVAPRRQEDGLVRAFTSPTYGRVWDSQVVAAVRAINGDGRWRVPAASYSAADPQRATTLYASDADLFIFLCDPARPMQVNGSTMFRGFITWNSEVGDRTFGLMTFLYNLVCDNRIIWGASQIEQVLIRHTGRGPDRFTREAAPALRSYSESGTTKLLAQVQAARAKVVAPTVEGVGKWLLERGFTQSAVRTGLKLAETDTDTGSSGDPTTLWNVVQGMTAYARGIEHADNRFDFERKVGKLLEIVG